MELHDHFPFHSGCGSVDGHIGPVVVVSREPFHGLILCFLNRFKDILVQPFVLYRVIVTRDRGLWVRLNGLAYTRCECVPSCRMFAEPNITMSRFSSGFFRAMFAMKEIWYGNEIHRRVSA